MGYNTRITYQTYMEYITHVNKYTIMNIANTNACLKTYLGKNVKSNLNNTKWFYTSPCQVINKIPQNKYEVIARITWVSITSATIYRFI